VRSRPNFWNWRNMLILADEPNGNRRLLRSFRIEVWTKPLGA
jgi:hypothetical protein